MRWILMIGLLVSSLAQSLGQPGLSASATEALIGDQIELTLRVRLQDGQEWVNQDVVPADTVAAIDVVATGTPMLNAGQMVQQWTIAVFDTGYVRVPPVPVVIRSGGAMDTIFSNDIPLRIAGVTDSVGMAPIKPLVYEPVKLSDYLPYALGALVLAGLVAGAILWSRRPAKTPEIREIIDQKTPDQVAFEQLDQLASQKLWQKGEIVAYHSRLSQIIRGYLEGRFGIQALESTTSEIIGQLNTRIAEINLIEETRKMMQLEDLVKFAKATPPQEIHEQHMTFAREFVRNTRIVEQNQFSDDQ